MGGKPTNTIITLEVDTDALIANPSDINNCVVFSDNQSDPAETPGRPDLYVSTVNQGATCTWQGVAKNKRDKINITVVAKKTKGGGADILEEITLGDPINDPNVVAKVKNAKISGEECYNVTFIINKNTSQSFKVDPRLKINQ